MADEISTQPQVNTVTDPTLRQQVAEALAAGPAPQPAAADSAGGNDEHSVPMTLAVVPGPGASRWAWVRYYVYKYFGTLLMSRTNHGDVVMSLERTSYVLLLGLAALAWNRGGEIPETMARFMDILVGAVFGQGVLSTVALYIRSKHGATK